jgi:uncharacterized protein (DUF302 family)
VNIPPDRVVTKSSPWSVADTVSRLQATIAARGLTLFALIDHGREAQAHGLSLHDCCVVIFSSTLAVTPIIGAIPLAGLDLPMRVLVWADGMATNVSYVDPASFAAHYRIADDLATGLWGIGSVVDAAINV